MTFTLAKIIHKLSGIVMLVSRLVTRLMGIFTASIHSTKRVDTIQAVTRPLTECLRATPMDKNGFYGATQ